MGLGTSIFKFYKNRSKKCHHKVNSPYFSDWMCSLHFEFPCPCKWQRQLQFLKNKWCQIVKRKFVWVITCSNLHFLKQINCMKKPKHLLNVHSIVNVVFQNRLWRIIITSLINIHEGGNMVSFFLTEKILSM